MSQTERIVRYTAEEIDEKIRRGEDQTDWARVDALTDEEIEASIDRDEEGEIDWNNLHIGMPPVKKQLTVRFDEDVITWFRDQGPRYQTRMNQVLRSYMEAQRRTG